MGKWGTERGASPTAFMLEAAPISGMGSGEGKGSGKRSVVDGLAL